MKLFPDTPSNILQFRAIAGNASNNIYAIVTRSDDETYFVVRYDGTQWDIHAWVTSHKFVTAYVAPNNGDVFIGGRGLSGGGTIIFRAIGSVDDPTAPADFYGGGGFIFNSLYGFGTGSLTGLPDLPIDELFFTSSNGLWYSNGLADPVRPEIDGLSFLPNAGECPRKSRYGSGEGLRSCWLPNPFLEMGIGRIRIFAFSSDGTSLAPAGDTGSPAWYLGEWIHRRGNVPVGRCSNPYRERVSSGSD